MSAAIQIHSFHLILSRNMNMNVAKRLQNTWSTWRLQQKHLLNECAPLLNEMRRGKHLVQVTFCL